MALTDTGLTVPTFDEIREEIVNSQKANISSSIDVSNSTALGQLNQIFANQLASSYALQQDIYDQRNIWAAEGKALDDLVTILGLTRQPARATAGDIYFTGIQGTNIPVGTLVRNEFNQDNYSSTEIVTLDVAACRECKISILNVVNSQLYTVTLQGTNYTYTSDGDATAEEIVAGLVADIGSQTDITITDNLDGTMVISSDLFVDISVAIDTNLKIDNVTSVGNVQCTETGVRLAPANTITEILTPSSGLNSVNNPQQLVQGREVETDGELRTRALNFRAASGTATVDSILAALANVNGVTTQTVNEQYYSQGTGSNGQPAGSIQIVVTGGDDDDIAQVIWDTKPAGIEVWGETPFSTGNATDTAGNIIPINFNRPQARDILNIVVQYKVFDTAVYPATDQEAYDAITTAIIAFGGTLNAGEDVDPTEFEGSVYAAVNGIFQVSITMEGGTSIIPVASNEQAIFLASNITVTNIT